MIKKRIQNLGGIIGVICLCTVFQVSAKDRFFNASAMIVSLTLENNMTAFRVNPISIKRGEKYDESKDPALRKGTENNEQPQSSFFAVPALILGVAGLVLFFNRNKNNP